MEWLITAAGALLVLAVLRDIFHTLWHPTGRGTLTRLLMGGAWRTLQGMRSNRRLELAGPLAMVLVVLAWGALVVAGCALVYWPHMPSGFAYSPGLDPQSRSSLLDAVYVSTVTLATLGYGDIVPDAGWLRVVAPLEGLIGFALLTAAVSWVLQVYPALARRRVLALRLSMLEANDAASTVRALASSAVADLLDRLAGDIVQVRVDLTQYAETYYYREGDPRASLAAVLEYAVDLADAGRASPAPSMWLAAATLEQALVDLCQILRTQFGRQGETVREVLRDFAAEHRHPPGPVRGAGT